MSRSARFLTAVVLCVLVGALAPSGALAASTKKAAASTSASASAAPLVVGQADGQIWPGQEGQQTIVIVDVVLDPKVKLPARVRVPVPVGGVIQWAGEILGGSPEADPERPFDLQTGAGGAKYAEFTLSASRRGQIDTAGIPMTAQGNDVSAKVNFVQSARATSTGFSVRIPAGVSDVRIVPAPSGPPDVNSAGESLYPLPRQTLALGAATVVTVTYNLSPTAASQKSPDNTTIVYLVLGVLLAAVIAVTVYLVVKQARDSQTPDGDDQTETDDDAEYQADDAESDAEEDDARDDAQTDADDADDAWSD